MGTWQAAATSKNPFTILKRFLQIRPYSYGKFSLLSDNLEFDLNTFTLNYDRIKLNPNICTDFDLKVLKSYQLD